MVKITLKRVSATLIFLVIFIACSRKDDRFLSRNFHALSTHNNILFNGKQALITGQEALNDAYVDDYWQILPIERLEIREEVALDSESENENFSTSEEKAVKAIQKHSMLIDGKEKNPKIDDAYLLLGKSRYFDQRFIPALEAFNYILYKYPASNRINHAKIWREKTNMRLNNNELAIKNLKKLLENEQIKNQDLADASATLAQAYINIKALDSAIAPLEVASVETKNNDERGRYRFIQGQLYNALEKKDSANWAFDKVIALNRKTPRVYYISAYIEKAKNFDYQNGNKAAFKELLEDLESNRENRPYLGRIYHQIAEYHNTQNADSLAEVFYNKSLQSNRNNDQKLSALNYELIGNLKFKNAQYQLASAYYDSTLTQMDAKTKPYRVMKRKRDNLDDVIMYETLAKTNDSILHIVNLAPSEREAFFSDYTAQLKAAYIKEQEAAAEAAQTKALIAANSGSQNKKNKNMTAEDRSNPTGSFYFYNPTTVAYGKIQFRRIWGDIALTDNWKYTTTLRANDNIINNNEEVSADSMQIFNPDYYLKQLPTRQTAIDSIVKDRNFAYYQLGLIYKEKFKEYALAKSRLTDLLTFKPEEKLVLPTKYNLYKIHELLGESTEANHIKNDIVTNYPDSRYATIINNPKSANIFSDNSPEALYKATYNQYENQEYISVIQRINDYITVFQGEPVLPKFELLKAHVIGRMQGFESYKEALNYVALTYPNSDEGKRAQELTTVLLPNIESSSFVSDSIANSFKIVYIFKNSEKQQIESFSKYLKDKIAQDNNEKLSVSSDFYNPDTTFVVIHGFDSRSAAEKNITGYLKAHKFQDAKQPYIIISLPNYQTIQIHKNLEKYITNQSHL